VETVVVVVGGGVPAADAVVPGDYVIAADSGLDQALALGLAVDLVVGDLDSVSPSALATARSAGIPVEAHPAEKDETDLELALGKALDLGASEVVVLGGAGGRFDHVLANALVLASDRYASVVVSACFGAARVHVVRDQLLVEGAPGDLVTLLAVNGVASGVTTEGLLYPLHDVDLPPATSRGVSNQFVTPTATVSLRDGVLLAILPHA
jgi:thiamine pyrophosphokinase